MYKTLEECIKEIPYTSYSGIWAQPINGKFEPDSLARIGKTSDVNGGVGVADGLEFVCNGKFPYQMGEVYGVPSRLAKDWDGDFISYLCNWLSIQC